MLTVIVIANELTDQNMRPPAVLGAF